MKRHVSVAILLGTVTIAVSAQTPQPKPQAGPLVDSSRLLLQIDQTAPSGVTGCLRSSNRENDSGGAGSGRS